MRLPVLLAIVFIFVLACGEANNSPRCLITRFFDEDIDPWEYQGYPLPYDRYRDHTFIFNGDDVPVPAGTMIRIWSHRYSAGNSISVRLEGEHADFFEAAYHSEYEFTANGWIGTSGSWGHYLAIWYMPHEERTEQFQTTDTSLVITNVVGLEEGEYEFDMHVESEGIVDCGQVRFEPRKLSVVVDRERATIPPAPTGLQVTSEGLEGWTINWAPMSGVDYYWVKVYRLDGDEEDIDPRLAGGTDGLSHRIRSAAMEGCGDVVYVEIWPEGDGDIYLDDFGEPSETIRIEAESCESRLHVPVK